MITADIFGNSSLRGDVTQYLAHSRNIGARGADDALLLPLVE